MKNKEKRMDIDEKHGYKEDRANESGYKYKRVL
jgi:hypothetical protein